MQSAIENVTVAERGLRYLVGMAMIMAVLIQPGIPAWVSLLATYPVFTAIMGWDPFYALAIGLLGSRSAVRLVDRPAV